jgi:hypothetical protein
MDLILHVAVVISCILLALSIYPGLLSELVFFGLISSPFWLPTLCISLWVYVDMAHQVPDDIALPSSRRLRLVAGGLLVLNGVLHWYGVPRHLGFLHSRPAFEALVAAAPHGFAGLETVNRSAGVYRVHRCAADFSGGVYFATHAGTDGFRSGRMTHGFSYRPNPVGSPFGDEKYRLYHILGDWYAFQAFER